MLPVLRAVFSHRAALADVTFALVFTIAFTVGGSIAYDLVLHV